MTTNTHSLDYEQTRCTVTDSTLALIDKSYARSDKLNITSITGAVTDTLGYPGGSNRIADVVTGTTATRTFTHDGAGNITTDVRSGSTYTFGYNARGRLAR